MFHHFLQHHWSMLQLMKFSKQTWLNLSCKMWKQREKEMRKGSPVSILLFPSVFSQRLSFRRLQCFEMFPRFIWLSCLASSSEWNFIYFCCVSVRWKEAVLVLWATCKHSIWSPDWCCGLAFWKGRVCPFPFGRVTLANYSCVLMLTSPQLYSHTNTFSWSI